MKLGLKKDIQTLIEENMEKFFNVKFLKSEYVIPEGRMDSIGIDENYCPVIFEYKRGVNENVINQGLFYLDWLMGHKADFKILVLERFDEKVAEKIDWSAPSVFCVAYDFTLYDLHAVNQIGKNIRLVRYRKYGEGIILFEHLNAPKLVNAKRYNQPSPTTDNMSDLPHEKNLAEAPEKLRDLYNETCEYIESLGDDISLVRLQYWIAYKKVQNVVCLEINKKRVAAYLKIDPDTVTLEDGFSESVKNKGHFGTGDLRLLIKSAEDLEKAKPLIERAYNEA